MKILFLALLLNAIIAPCIAQDEMKPVVKFTGLVKSDFTFDSRQTVGAREGHFLLWPQPEKLDPDGRDINAKRNFNFLAIQSRAGASISGIEYKGAKISGTLEGDFFGQLDNTINLIRLRHAFVRINWEKTELMFGQYWNPLFTLDCFPGTVSFNTGVPFVPFSRNVQIRAIQKMGNFRLMAAALGQRDYTCLGGSETLRNSGVPDFHAQIHYQAKNTKNTEFVTGIAGAFKTIVPHLETVMGYKTDESVSSFSALGFIKFKNSVITTKLSGLWGENLYDVVQISSYAIKEETDPVRKTVSYSPISNGSVWGEIHTHTKIQLGVFAGYTKNLGTREDIISVPTSRSHNIDYVWRVSPRVIVPYGKVNFGLEVEHTAAAFGAVCDRAKILNPVEVANTRLLFSSYLSF